MLENMDYSERMRISTFSSEIIVILLLSLFEFKCEKKVLKGRRGIFWDKSQLVKKC